MKSFRGVIFALILMLAVTSCGKIVVVDEADSQEAGANVEVAESKEEVKPEEYYNDKLGYKLVFPSDWKGYYQVLEDGEKLLINYNFDNLMYDYGVEEKGDFKSTFVQILREEDLEGISLEYSNRTFLGEALGVKYYEVYLSEVAFSNNVSDENNISEVYFEKLKEMATNHEIIFESLELTQSEEVIITYEGSINQKYMIHMTIVQNDVDVIGSYYYDSRKIDIPFTGYINGDKLTITTDDGSETFEGTYEADKIYGTWTMGDTVYDFEIFEESGVKSVTGS